MEEWVLTAYTSLQSPLLIARQFIKVVEWSYYNTDLIQIGLSNAFMMEKHKKRWKDGRMEGTRGAYVYSNTGGIDQPTYFLELTHCSLKWEVKGNVLFKIENPEKPEIYQYCLLMTLVSTGEKEDSISDPGPADKSHFYRFMIPSMGNLIPGLCRWWCNAGINIPL